MKYARALTLMMIFMMRNDFDSFGYLDLGLLVWRSLRMLGVGFVTFWIFLQ